MTPESSSETSPEVSVLVADAQQVFGDALRLALGHEPGLRALPEAPVSGTDALELVKRHGPDVVVLDYWLRGMNGSATSRAIHAWSPGPKVVMLGWLHGPHHVKDALAAGAAAFLGKSGRFEELVEAVWRAAALGSTGLTPGLPSPHRPLVLTPREIQVLQHLALGRSPDAVAQELGVARGTVKNHIHHILSKTGARTYREAVAAGRHQGLVAPE